MYNTPNKILDRVVEHHNKVIELGYHPIYTALYGSQNYDLATAESDIDTKSIVLPSFEDIVLGRPPVTTTHMFDNGEQCDIKDIREMVKCWRKQNINFLEILFTKYFVINEAYKDELDNLRYNKESVAHYDNYAFLSCARGMALEKQKALMYPYPTIKWKIEKWGYDGKQLSHILRMKDFIERFFFDNEPYESCLVSKDNSREKQLRAKRQEYKLSEAVTLADEAVLYINNIIKLYRSEHGVVYDSFANMLLKEFVTESLKKKFKREFIEECV